MDNTFTQEFKNMEQEAGWWLAVYEALPDSMFEQSNARPSEIVIKKLKDFSKAFTTLTFNGQVEMVMIN